MCIQFQYNDGGRKDAGFYGSTGDCVVRAIAIALELPYKQVYDELREENELWIQTRRSDSRVKRNLEKRGVSPRKGVSSKITRKYLTDKGWKWTPTMHIGQGCKVHVRTDEVPMNGRAILKLSGHVATVVDGVLNDTYDCSRNGTRCVYGFYTKE